MYNKQVTNLVVLVNFSLCTVERKLLPTLLYSLVDAEEIATTSKLLIQ